MKENIERHFRTDIVYKIPEAKDEIVVWKESGKRRLRKYYLIVNLMLCINRYVKNSSGAAFLRFVLNIPKMFSLIAYQKSNVNVKYMKI